MHLIVLRGLPGSGKTTYTNKLIQEYSNIEIISNDSLRTDDNGYNYIYENNNYIYQENYKLLINYLKNGTKIIVIDNCNINIKLLDIYYDLSVKYNYRYLQLVFPKPTRENIFKSLSRCQHNISNSSYLKMWLSFKSHYKDNDVNKINLANITTIEET